MRYIIPVIATTLFFLLDVFCNEISIKQVKNITFTFTIHPAVVCSTGSNELSAMVVSGFTSRLT